jgi:hypothetical protein
MAHRPALGVPMSEFGFQVRGMGGSPGFGLGCEILGPTNSRLDASHFPICSYVHVIGLGADYRTSSSYRTWPINMCLGRHGEQCVPRPPGRMDSVMALCLTGPRSAGSAFVPERGGDGLPSDGIAPVRATSLRALRNLRMMHLLERLALAFEAAGVPVMALKGAALNLTVYPGPGDRPMDDLDLLVRPGMATRAIEVLEAMGCSPGEPLVREDFFPRFHYEREFRTGAIHPVKIDLHVRPFRPLRYSRTVPPDALWSRAQRVHWGRAKILIPCAEEMVIHLAAHGAIHGNARRMWLEDVHHWVRVHDGTLNWDEILRTAAAWGLSLPVREGLERVEREVGPTCPDRALACLRRMKPGWRARLALRQAPRDAIHPAAHVLVDGVCTPGIGFVLSYLAAMAFPGREHMADWYGRKHLGWLPCAHILRLLRPVLGRFPAFWRRLMRIERRSGSHGVGVFATCGFGPGRVIVKHFGLSGKLRSLNHSCRPNARLEGARLLAVRKIESGQEVTIDYGPRACTCRERSAHGRG